MELKEAIDKLFEMTDEQRLEVFNFSDVRDVLDNYLIDNILRVIENFYSEPKYGDVYLDEMGHKFIVLDASWGLSEKYECPQKMSFEFIAKCYTKTGKNVADKLQRLFE